MNADEHAGFTKFGIPRWQRRGNEWIDTVTNEVVAEIPNRPRYKPEPAYDPLGYMDSLTHGDDDDDE